MLGNHRGFAPPDHSQQAGVGWTPHAKDTSEANREQPKCQRHPLSRSRYDILFTRFIVPVPVQVGFQTRFEQLVFVKRVLVFLHRFVETYREVGTKAPRIIVAKLM